MGLKIGNSGGRRRNWFLVGPTGKHDPAEQGMELTTATSPYMECEGPRYVGAKLNKFSAYGEGTGSFAQSGLSNAEYNSGLHLYGNEAQYRIRLFYTGGMTPAGTGGLTPDSFDRLWTLTLSDGQKRTISKVGEVVQTSKGTLSVVGLADLGTARETCGEYNDLCYVEDRDNYLDIIIRADNDETAALIASVQVRSGLFNPGGPGMDHILGVEFTQANSPQTIDVINDLSGAMQVTYCDGRLLDNSNESAQRCGRRAGVPKDYNSKSTFPSPAVDCNPWKSGGEPHRENN